MLSDLTILVEQAAKAEEFQVDDVKTFLATRLATRESKRITKADISHARTHFGCGKQKSGPRPRRNRNLKRKAESVSDGSEPEGKRVRVNEVSPPQIPHAHAAPAALMPATSHHVGPSRVVW